MSNYTADLLADQETKVWEYVYLIRSAGDVALYADGFVLANNIREATDKVTGLVDTLYPSFDPEHKVISVRPFGRAINVE